MSFFDDASLAFLPSGAAGKDGKAYSIKPTDGTGDFTFSRGSNLSATRVGADGLIEKGRENLLTKSNQFDGWNLQNVTSGHAGYDGTNNAYLQSGTSRLQRNISLGTSVYTGSIYVKAGFSNYVQLYLVGSINALARFELIGNGTIVNSGGISPKIEPVSGATGWYRILTNLNASITSFRIYPQNDSSGTQTADSSIYIQDAQLEIGLAATEVIESGATTGKAGLLEDEPRFDYSGGATCPSLLLEPSRTQLITQSEYFGGYSNSNSTDEPNATTSPEGLTNATSFLEAATTGQHKLATSISFDGSSTYTFSVFAKSNGRDLYVDTQNSNEWGGRAWFDLTAGTANSVLGTADIEDFGNGWYRCIVTGASTLAGGNQVELLTSDGSTNSTTGDVTKGVYIYGAQLEAGSYPTSYIPNHSNGTITRGADVCGNAGDVNTFNSTEGVLYLEASAIDNGSSEKGLALNDGGTNNRINIRILNNNIRAYGIVGGSLVCLMTYTAPSVTSINKIAFKYKENDFALWVNGVERVTDNSGSIFPANTLNELSFDYGGASAFFYGNVKQVLTFNTALSDADLTTLTT